MDKREENVGQPQIPHLKMGVRIMIAILYRLG